MDENYLVEYLRIIDTGSIPTLKYLKKNHKRMKILYGHKLFRECFLNYRIWYHINKNNNFRLIKKLILKKDIKHKSDLAIIHNYIQYNKLSKENKKFLTKELILIYNDITGCKHNQKEFYTLYKIKEYFNKHNN